MKNIKKLSSKRGFFVITTMVLTMALVSIFFMGMSVDKDVNLPLGISGTISEVDIIIEKPKTWQTKETSIPIKVTTEKTIKKVEARIGDKGSWVDVTDEMAINISENATVYVQVTDKNGNVYTKSRYLEVFDRVIPTIKARVSKTTIQIECDDDLSGVLAVYIDGQKYDSFTNDTINLPVKDVATKEYATISVYAVDKAGNRSTTLELKNPLFVDESQSKSLNEKPSTTSESQGGASTTTATSGNGSTTSNTTGTATGTNTTASTTKNPETKNTASTSSSEAEAKKDSGSTGESENPLFGTYKDTNKQFLSIVTKEGQVFYMIIDYDRESENVYLLTEVKNGDLQNFNEQEAVEQSEFVDEQTTEKETEKVGLDDEYVEESKTEISEAPPLSEETKESEKPQQSSSIFLIILIALVVLGGGYYVKIYKPKKELENADNLDDYNFVEENEVDELDKVVDKFDEDEEYMIDEEEAEQAYSDDSEDETIEE